MRKTELIFTSIKSFENAGVWQNYLNPTNLQFTSKNLIYGFNGSGKTTLSRIFASIERGELESKLPNSTAFSVETSDGKTISSTAIQNPFANSLLVFNQDFIERNFKWDDSRADGIAYISEMSVAKRAEYETALAKYEESESHLQLTKNRKLSAEKALKAFKTDASRRVRELAPSKRYSQSFDAKKIDPEYSKRDFTDDDIITEEEIGKRQKLLGQEEALPKLTEFTKVEINIKEWIFEVFDLLKSTPGSVLSREFQVHSEALKWAHEGLQYHQEHNLQSCLFCGNELTEHRKQELVGNFDNAWEKFVSEVNQVYTDCSQHIELFRKIYGAVPKEVEVQSSEKNNLKVLRPKLIGEIAKILKFLKAISDLLQMKASNPAKSVIPSETMQKLDVEIWWESYASLVTELQELISRHNLAYAEFSIQQNQAFETIKNHVLASERQKNSNVKTGLIEATSSERVAHETFNEARRVRDKLNNELSNHGVGADKLNDLLAMYLGHRDIQLRALEIGYQLIRADGEPAQHLSEGEKTALAFCYFLTKFGAENRTLKDLIVVIDDPISSLDTSARTHAFSLLTRMTKKCAQTIIMTHNMSFMNMVKREFQKLQKRDETKIVTSLFSLECTCDSNDLNNRCTNLVEMSPLLQKYDTEYHFLFDMVKQASEERNSPHHYLLPNATRKLLEMFAAFCSPNHSNFSAALMEHHGALKDKLDIKALERLVQLESHGTLEGVTSLPTLTIEEAIRATEATMKFIKELAPSHYKAMQKCL